MSVESIVNITAGKISELLVQEAKLLYGVRDQIQSLQEEVAWISSFLKDMEVTMYEQAVDQRCRQKTKEIRRIAYDAEDLIDSYILESKSSTSKVEDFFSKYVCFSNGLGRTHRVGRDIEAIKSRISQTTERSNRYRGENGGRRASGEGMGKTKAKTRVTYPLDYEDHVVGLEEDVNKLVELLTTDNSQMQVLLIAGMGGSGKTTLAQKLYNDKRIKTHFDCMAWASISEQWNTRQILLDILTKASGQTMKSDGARSQEFLAETLQEYLEEKRHFIVLDDVWRRQALQEILPALPPKDDRRKIVITTRNREVVDFPNLQCHIHEPRRLTDQESWDIFRRIALRDREEIAFKKLAKEMLEKCEGLPLAVIALAGILYKKETLEEWEKVKKAISSKIMKHGCGTHEYGQVDEMLELSYNDLPFEIKPCFLYLAIFPEDYEIPIGKLIRMWVAEGFILHNQGHDGDTLEDVAREYLDELIQRCMVQIARRNHDGKVRRIKIHDLMRELCVKKAKEEEFLEIFSYGSPNLDGRVTRSRRTAFHNYREGFPLPAENLHLRSLHLSGQLEIPTPIGFGHLYKSFKLLRVLSVEYTSSSDGDLPKEIGSLIHLRYMRLWNTNIYKLPSSIGNLHNLQTLDYRNLSLGAWGTVEAPKVLWKMESLRHLYLPVSDFVGLNLKNLKLRTLKQLQTLWGVEGGDWMVEELPHLSPSVQKLKIIKIKSSEQLEAVFLCPSVSSDRLHSLYLNWTNYDGCSLPTRGGVEGGDWMVEAIAHCQHLRKLALCGSIEDKLGCLVFPSSITYLSLAYTRLEAEATLGALGKLPSLKVLRLEWDAYLGTKWTCTAGEFSQLRELALDNLDNLEQWSIESGAMPQLRKLKLESCGKLSRLPEGLKFITTLQELDLKWMPWEFQSRIKSGGEDAHITQHIPVVQI